MDGGHAARPAAATQAVSEAATQTLARIVRDTITNCPDHEPYLGDTRLLGDVHLVQEAWRHEFWAAWFEPDPSERARFKRVLAAPGEAFRDLARLHRHETGEAAWFPPALGELLRQRLALAYFPSADIVVRRARSGSALYAAQSLTRYIGAEQWRAKS